MAAEPAAPNDWDPEFGATLESRWVLSSLKKPCSPIFLKFG